VQRDLKCHHVRLDHHINKLREHLPVVLDPSSVIAVIVINCSAFDHGVCSLVFVNHIMDPTVTDMSLDVLLGLPQDLKDEVRIALFV
jgi:hypothetical protein